MKTIILATDFSSAALNAGAYALKMANTINAAVVFLNVYEVIVNYGEMVMDLDVNDLRKNADTEMLNFKSTLLQQTNTNSSITTEVRLGVFKDELISICERINPYAVVMGCQEKTAMENFLLGGHAGKTINHFTWPIITVPASAVFADIKKIAIAYDFNAVIEEDLIRDIKLLAIDFNATVDILNAADEDEFDAELTTLSHTLERAFKPLTINYNFISTSNTEDGILAFVDENNIDLLVVMPKQHNFFQQLFQKSHTKKLILHSHVPVLSLNKQNL